MIETKTIPQIVIGRLYRPDEVGTLLGFHKETVRRAIRENRIECVRLGRWLRVPGSALVKIMAEGLPPMAGGVA